MPDYPISLEIWGNTVSNQVMINPVVFVESPMDQPTVVVVNNTFYNLQVDSAFSKGVIDVRGVGIDVDIRENLMQDSLIESFVSVEGIGYILLFNNLIKNVSSSGNLLANSFIRVVNAENVLIENLFFERGAI